MTTDLDAQLARVEAVAQRRWTLRLAARGAFVVLGIGAINAFDDRSHSVGAIVAGGVVAIALAWFIGRRGRRRRDGFWSAPSWIGLDRDERRTVRRDLRRGTPSSDPLLLEIERQTIGRLTRARPVPWIFWAVAALAAVLAVAPRDALVVRVACAVMAVVLIVGGTQLYVTMRHADHF